MKEFFKRKKDGDTQAESSEPKLGGVFFGFTEQGQKHAVSMADMPEDVKAYLEELGRQAHEEGGGVVTLSSDNMPDYVVAYMHEQVERVIKDIDVTKIRMKDLPHAAVDRAMMDIIDGLAQHILEKDPAYKAPVDYAVGLLKTVFKALLHTDEDWRQLTMAEVNDLFGGVCVALIEVMVAGERLRNVGFAGKKEKEDRNDEEDS